MHPVRMHPVRNDDSVANQVDDKHATSRRPASHPPAQALTVEVDAKEVHRPLEQRALLGGEAGEGVAHGLPHGGRVVWRSGGGGRFGRGEGLGGWGRRGLQVQEVC
jgi:hypothetical protein